MSSITKTASVLFIALVVLMILYFGRSLMIPFILALLIWFLIREVLILLEKVPYVKKYFPAWLRTTLVITVIFALIGLVGQTLSRNIQTLLRSYTLYEKNLETIAQQINQIAGRDVALYLQNFLGDINFGKIFGELLNSLSSLLGSSFLIVIYVVFIFTEEAFFQPKLRAICQNDVQYANMRSLIDRIGDTMTHYIGLKSLMSLITGVLSYLILLFIGINSPAFWAFLIFILNFIPNIGSMVATVFPAIFSLLQFGAIWPFILILLLVGTVQVLVGNFLEPKVMGQALNISPLVTILALSFWGVLWGITGMLLSVPITVMCVIIFTQFNPTKPFAILLSKTGEITNNG